MLCGWGLWVLEATLEWSSSGRLQGKHSQPGENLLDPRGRAGQLGRGQSRVLVP